MSDLGAPNSNRSLVGPNQLTNDWWLGGDQNEWLPNDSGIVTVQSSLTLDAVLLRSVTGSFALDAFLVRTTSATFTLDAALKATQAATFALDAALLKAQSSAFALDAAISTGGFTGSFTLDAYLQAVVTSTFTLDSVLRQTQSSTFTLDSVLRRSQSASFTLDALVGYYFTLDAVIYEGHIAHFSLNAQLFKRTTSSFTLDSVFISHRASFTLDAWIQGRITNSFTLNAQIIPVPVPPTQRTKAFVKVNNVDYADDIIYADAEFTAQVNGQPGTCHFRVRDVHHIYSFVSGQEIRFWVGDTLVWGGYITRAQPGYAFKVDNTQNPTLTERIWVIEGVDYNILFQRRYLIDVDHPTQSFPLYPIGTHDDVMVRDLVNDFLILSGDNLDPSGIEFVGVANPDLKFNFGNPGDSWGQAMSFIARANGAIFYIDPNRTIYYVDDDAREASLILSDRPNVGGSNITITDTFDRTVASGWGTGQLGTWNRVTGASGISSVNGTQGLFGSGGDWLYIPVPGAFIAGTEIIGSGNVIWQSGATEIGGDWATNTNVSSNFAEWFFDSDGSMGIFDDQTGNETTTITPPVVGQLHHWKYSLLDGSVRLKFWNDNDPEPAYQLTMLTDRVTPTSVLYMAIFANGSGSPLLTFNDVAITGISGAPPSIGYRDLEILNNGTNLVNDMLVWGAGTGSQNGLTTFARAQDAASINAHGRWQRGDFRTDMYRQTTVNQRASSFVYGSPQNLRGGKDDAVTIICTIFEPGFTVGQKVRVISEIFDLDDIFPIRRMRITFPVPSGPMFELTLTHEVDDPWNTAEFYWPPINFESPPGPKVDPPPPITLPPTGGNCSDAICGITDDFERTLTNNWGVATCGQTWRTALFQTDGTIGVDGSAGTISLGGGTAVRGMILGGTGSSSIQRPITGDVKTMRFQLPGYTAANVNAYELHWEPLNHPGLVVGPVIGIGGAPGAGDSYIDITTFHSPGPGDIPLSFWSASKTYTWTVWKTGSGGLNQTITDGTSTYSPGESGSSPTYAMCALSFRSFTFAAAQTVRILDIDIPEITRCGLNVFDDFQRSVVGAWGTASSGTTWSFISGHQAALSVSGIGTMDLNNNDGVTVYAAPAPPYNTNFEATLEFQSWPLNAQFQFGVVGAVTFHLDPDSDGHIKIVTNSETASTSFSFSNDADYYVKVGHTWGVASTMKIWQVGTAEPDWMITALTSTALGSNNQWFMAGATAGGVGPGTFFVASLDFDYSGKPCFGATCETFDDFGRVESGQWGMPSSTTAYSWSDQTDNPTLAVSGGFAHGEVSNFGLDGIEFGYLELFQTDNGSPDDDGFSQLPFTMTASFKYDAIPPSPQASMDIGWRVVDNFTDATNLIAVDFDVDSGSSFFIGYSDSDLNQLFDGIDITPPTPGTVVYIKWNVDSTGIRGKIWWDSEEPSSWMVEALGPMPLFVNDWKRLIAATGTGAGAGGSVPEWSTTIYFGPIDFCSTDTTVFGEAAPLEGEYCELASAVSSSVYQLSRAFQAGSARVFLNGLIQRPGGLLDYTEDPANGEIVFTGPEFPEPGSSVYVCYIITGAL